MILLSVSSLGSWVHCPRQFFVQQVLRIKEPPNGAMVLGLIKHKFHELASQEEEQLVCAIPQSGTISQLFEDKYRNLLRTSVVKHAASLQSVGIPLSAAFEKSLFMIKQEASEKARLLQPLVAQGLSGTALWHALKPKVKSEYPVKSEKLGLKGRIDKLECYEDKIVPIELKSGRTPDEGVYDSHRIQAGCYALLLEEQFKTTVPEAIVHYVDSNTRRPIVLNPFLREWILQTAQSARNCLETREIPKGCQKEECTACKLCEDEKTLKKHLPTATLRKI